MNIFPHPLSVCLMNNIMICLMMFLIRNGVTGILMKIMGEIGRILMKAADTGEMIV